VVVLEEDRRLIVNVLPNAVFADLLGPPAVEVVLETADESIVLGPLDHPVADVVSIDGGDSRGTGADSLGNLVAIRIPTERGAARQRAQVVERGEPIEVVKDPLRVRKDRPAGVLLRLP